MKDTTKDKDSVYYVRKLINALSENRIARWVLLLAVIILGGAFLQWFVPALKGFAYVPFSVDLAIPLIDITIQLRLYTVLVMAGLMAALLVVLFLQADYQPLRDLDIWEVLMFVLIPGIVFGRFYYVLTTPTILENNPLAWIQLGDGGLSIIGGIFGGLLGLWAFARWRLYDFKLLATVAAIALPLAQAIGRWGNFFNLELLGHPTNKPWGMYVNPLFRPAGFAGSEHFHPIFLYESIASLTLFLGLAYLWKYLRQNQNQERFKAAINSALFIKIYIAWYFCIRFWIDFIRIDGSVRPEGLTITQWLILASFVGVIMFSLGYQLWFKHKYGVWFTQHAQLGRIRE